MSKREQRLASASSPEAQLAERQATTNALQAAALDSQQAVAAAAGRTSALSTQAVLVAAYTRRLQRLASLLAQYDAHLHQALSALGLTVRCQPVCDKDLAAGLHQLQQELAAAIASSGAAATEGPPGPDALLSQLSSCGPLPARLAATAGPKAVLAALEEGIHADLAAVDSLPAAVQSDPSTCAAASPLASAAFRRLQQQQKEQWGKQEERRQQLERLRGEVMAAQRVLAGSSFDARGAARTRLAAQQAGLRAELECLERAKRRAGEQQAAAARRAAQVQGQQAGVAALEQQEEQLDTAVRAMCAADGQVMRQWRRDSWQAQQVLEASILCQRTPLEQLGKQLLAAQREELAAFRGASGARRQQQEGQEQDAEGAAGPMACAGQPGPGSSTGARAAAQLLDPLAHLKSDQHVAAVVAAAASELQQLQPAQEQWAVAQASSSAALDSLQHTAADQQQQVEQLRQVGSSATLQLLQEAAEAVEEGEQLLAPVRQALTEWWTSPAVTAAPWVKRGGRAAEEWLRVLGDQQRAQQQRDAFTKKDHKDCMQAAMS